MKHIISLLLVTLALPATAKTIANAVPKEVSKKAFETLILNASRVHITGDVAADETLGTLIHGYIFPDSQGQRPWISNACGLTASRKKLLCNLATESRLAEQFLVYAVDVSVNGKQVTVLGMSDFEVEISRGRP